MRSLKQVLIPFIERHVKTYHSSCLCNEIEVASYRDGILEEVSINGVFYVREIPKEAGE